ncbi:MAG: hypothetical protein CL930_12210 [Deltaproteobacteria bacterium]|nr:hypothetical protein [Deltaproteobacteria bacterium]
MRAAVQARSWPRRTESPKKETSSVRTPAIPVRPDIDVGQPEVAEADTAPRPRTRMDRVLKRGGRFRMKPTESSRAPVVRSVSSGTPEPSTASAEAPVEPPERKRVMPSLGGGMDDLFGAAAQLGRVSMRAPEASSEEE